MNDSEAVWMAVMSYLFSLSPCSLNPHSLMPAITPVRVSLVLCSALIRISNSVESGKSETVGSTSTSSGGSSGGSHSSGGGSSNSVIRVSSWSELRAAVQRVEDGGTIQLATDISDAGNTNTAAIDGVSSATLPMESATAGKAFTLDGNGHIITAASNSTYCFLINTGDSTGTTTVKNLTVDGGKFSKKVGGAFFVESGNVVFDGVTFKNCNAGNIGAFNGGGAICLNKHGSGMPNVTVTGCTFEDNYVGAAGATGRGGAIYANHGNRNPVTEDTQESNSAYNLCWNSCRVGRRINRTYIFVSYCCKSRTQTDKRIRTKSCRSLLPFPLNTKKCTKNQCQNKTHKYRHAIKFI